MIFSRIVYSAIAVGFVSGLCLSLMQISAVDPIIFEAETYEVACAGVGLGLLVLAQAKFKAIGALLIALPYLIGARHVDGPEFAHPDPDAVTALTGLHHDFIIATGAVNLLFWIALGLVCSLAFNRWFRLPAATDE